MERLTGRVALISGAASGIGEATAARLAKEGAAVVVSDVNDSDGEAVARALVADGARAIFVHLDVTSADDWANAVAATVAEFGQLDILVNNAGIGEKESIDDIPLDSWHRTIAVDQTGMFLGMKIAGPALANSQHASVINISSVFGMTGGFGTAPAYAAAKGAMRVLTKNVALHWAERGVRVNSIHPGFIETPMFREIREWSSEIVAYMESITPLGRLGRPEEIAAGVAYLASDDASYITGSELCIDGGYTSR